ncbi:MAG: hypothetical protein K2M05_06060 [Paramuribaculum sp.]|nr:hypothetical protein [Paramuribaculum sp.]
MQNVDGDLSNDRPINYLIETSGPQTLSVKLLSKPGVAGGSCRVEIWRNDGSGFHIVPLEQICLSELVFGKDNIGEVKSDMQIFNAEVPYTIWRWSNCIEIRDPRMVSNAAMDIYKQIGQAIAAGQRDRYMQYVRRREENICNALYLGEEEIEMRSNMIFECIEDGFTPVTMSGRKKIHLFSNKRVIAILDEDMKSALRFEDKESGDMFVLELLLGIKSGDRNLSVI